MKSSLWLRHGDPTRRKECDFMRFLGDMIEFISYSFKIEWFFTLQNIFKSSHDFLSQKKKRGVRRRRKRKTQKKVGKGYALFGSIIGIGQTPARLQFTRKHHILLGFFFFFIRSLFCWFYWLQWFRAIFHWSLYINLQPLKNVVSFTISLGERERGKKIVTKRKINSCISNSFFFFFSLVSLWKYALVKLGSWTKA